MTCADVKPLLDAFFDSELDLTASLRVERHLTECASCSATLANLERLRQEFTPAVFDRSPDSDLRALRDKVRKAVGAAPDRKPVWTLFPPRAAAILLPALVLAVLLVRTPPSPAVPRELVDSHVRSLMANHLVDVPTSDRHTVKPWFQGKLDFAPEVPDLSAKGFELVGGRLDVLNGRPAAAVVYRLHSHVINLWTSRTEAAGLKPAFSEANGYRIGHWSDSGMERWAVSDMGLPDLMNFVDLVRAR